MGNNSIKLIILALAVLLSVNSILALGVSSPYWKDNPLNMYPGQIKDVAFTLVNKPDAETAKAFVAMEDNAEIAEITSGAEYNVIPGSTNTKVILKISVPETATIGSIYNVKFSVKSAPSEEEGTVQLIMGYNINFPVKIVEQSQVSEDQTQEIEPKGTNWALWIVIILAILIISYFFLKKKKR